jgi:hypothetical protein
MNVLEEAQAAVDGPRRQDYGIPREDFARIAAMWSEVIGAPVTPEQAVLCMILVKVSRLCHSPMHRDSVVDIAGYARVYEMLTYPDGPPDRR